MENSPIMIKKPDDLTVEQCQEAFAIFRQKPDDLTENQCQEAFLQPPPAGRIAETRTPTTKVLPDFG